MKPVVSGLENSGDLGLLCRISSQGIIFTCPQQTKGLFSCLKEVVRTDLPWRSPSAAEDRLGPSKPMAQRMSVCVHGLAAGVVDASCYVDITAAQLSLLRRMWGLFPPALIGIVFFSSPQAPVPVKWDFEISLWKGLTRGGRLSCCQQRLMS